MTRHEYNIQEARSVSAILAALAQDDRAMGEAIELYRLIDLWGGCSRAEILRRSSMNARRLDALLVRLRAAQVVYLHAHKWSFGTILGTSAALTAARLRAAGLTDAKIANHPLWDLVCGWNRISPRMPYDLCRVMEAGSIVEIWIAPDVSEMIAEHKPQ